MAPGHWEIADLALLCGAAARSADGLGTHEPRFTMTQTDTRDPKQGDQARVISVHALPVTSLVQIQETPA